MNKLRIAYTVRFFPMAVFVHLVRDGRDCYCSALHHPNVAQSASLDGFARYWRGCVSLPEKLVPPVRLYSLRYEDLTSDPIGELKKLMGFLDLEFVPQQVDVNVYSSTTSIKKRDVHKNLSMPINTTSQARWKHDLTEVQNERFCQIAGRPLSRFGYSLGEVSPGDFSSPK